MTDLLEQAHRLLVAAQRLARVAAPLLEHGQVLLAARLQAQVAQADREPRWPAGSSAPTRRSGRGAGGSGRAGRGPAPPRRPGWRRGRARGSARSSAAALSSSPRSRWILARVFCRPRRARPGRTLSPLRRGAGPRAAEAAGRVGLAGEELGLGRFGLQPRPLLQGELRGGCLAVALVEEAAELAACGRVVAAQPVQAGQAQHRLGLVGLAAAQLLGAGQGAVELAGESRRSRRAARGAGGAPGAVSTCARARS